MVGVVIPGHVGPMVEGVVERGLALTADTKVVATLTEAELVDLNRLLFGQAR